MLRTVFCEEVKKKSVKVEWENLWKSEVLTKVSFLGKFFGLFNLLSIHPRGIFVESTEKNWSDRSFPVENTNTFARSIVLLLFLECFDSVGSLIGIGRNFCCCLPFFVTLLNWNAFEVVGFRGEMMMRNVSGKEEMSNWNTFFHK